PSRLSLALLAAITAACTTLPPPRPIPEAPRTTLRPVPFAQIPGWGDDPVAEAWPAFLTGCTMLVAQSATALIWREPCADAGRIDGRRVVPYWPRADIEGGKAPVAGKELVFVDDAVEAFFLQIQGSGRVQLVGGEVMRVGYADQNGQPFRSIARMLIERGALS